jgi:hypothetical protein
MNRRILAVASLSALATVASAADPQLLKLVMPDAKVVSGINVDVVKSTQFGQFFLSQLPAPDAGYQEFISVTGFDPRQDIHEVLMASPGDPQKKSGLLLVRGNFDSARILALVKTEGKTTETYHGVEVLTDVPGSHPVSHGLAFLDNTTAVAGDLDSVRGAIDRRTAASSLDPALTAKIGATSAAQDAWVVSIAPISSFAQAVPNPNVSGALQGDLIKAIQQSSGGVKFGAMIQFSGELTARTDQDASSLADVVRFFMNMAAMNSPTGGNPELNSLLHNLTVNTEANAVKVSVSIPEGELETLIKVSGHRGMARAPVI